MLSSREPSRLLEVRDLSVRYSSGAGPVTAVDRVSFSVLEGETLGLVGESGSGKTTTALSILRLIPPARGEIRGRVLFRGRDLLRLDEEEMCRVRGREIGMVFQEPSSALNPVVPVGDQVAESLVIHRSLGAGEARERAAEMLARVGIPDPRRCLSEYPHRLSGGMRQRALIAAALVCRPALLVADEPTSALDVTTQAQILELFRDLQSELEMAVLLVSHDLGVVAELADRVAVMYESRIVEQADVRTIFSGPEHPHTRALLEAATRLERGAP